MTVQIDPLNLIICGIGGQGNIRISRMIGKILNQKGYHVSIGETFGAAQRGGTVFSGMRVSPGKEYGPLIPKGKAHLVLSLEPLETLRLLGVYGNPEVAVITNTQPVSPVGVLAGEFAYPDLTKLQEAIHTFSGRFWAVDATEAAMTLNAPIVANIVMLGALAQTGIIPVNLGELTREIETSFPSSLIELNLRALSMGAEAVKEG